MEPAVKATAKGKPTDLDLDGRSWSMSLLESPPIGPDAGSQTLAMHDGELLRDLSYILGADGNPRVCGWRGVT